MWPMVLDYTKDECQRMLRKLELEAYAAVVSAFRAQGELTKDKKKTLQELSSILCISLERHRAEIRRAVNDERLNTIAERIVGPNTSSDWAIEGRRLVPLMPRLVPQTAFSALANDVANNVADVAKDATGADVTTAANKELLYGNGPSAAVPSCSGLNGPMAQSRTPQAAAVAPPSAARTPPLSSSAPPAKLFGPPVVKSEPTIPDVVQGDEDVTMRKRKRSLSLDSLITVPATTSSETVPTSVATAPACATAPTTPVAASPSAPAPPAVAAASSAVTAIASTASFSRATTSNGPIVTKVVVPALVAGTPAAIAVPATLPVVTTKVISLPTGPAAPVRVSAPHRTTTVPVCSQKVILVSTTAAPSPLPSSHPPQPALSVPVVKTVSAPGTGPLVHQGKMPPTVMVSSLAGPSPASSSSSLSPAMTPALTSVTSTVTAPVPSVSMPGAGEPGTVRPRPRAVTVNPRMPVRLPRGNTGTAITLGGPSGPQLPCPSYGKATISVPKGAIMQYRQEGTVKIIAQSQLPISSTKLGTKAGPGSPIVTASSSSSLSITPRVSTVSITSNQPRVVNVITASQPGIVRTLSRTVTPSTSGVNQRPGPTGLRPALGTGLHHSGAKPNVIVVHKAQVWPQVAQAGSATSSSSALSHFNKSTESFTFLQRQDRPKVSIGGGVGASGTTMTVVKTPLPTSQPCAAPVVRVVKETTIKTLQHPRKPSAELPSDATGSGGAAGSSILAELMQAAGILQEEAGQPPPPPPLLVISEDAVPPAEVEVAIDTVPLDDNAVLLDEGHLVVGSEEESAVETQGVVVEESPCLLQNHIVFHEVELVTQPSPLLEVAPRSPAAENKDAQSSSQNGQLSAENEPAAHMDLLSTSLATRQPTRLKGGDGGDRLPPSGPGVGSVQPRSPDRKRPGKANGDDGRDVPGASNGIVASGVAERLGLTVSGTVGTPASSSKTKATVTAQDSKAASSSVMAVVQPINIVPSGSVEVSRLPRRTDDSDLAVPGPSNVFTAGSAWKHSVKTLPPTVSLASEPQLNGPPRQFDMSVPPAPRASACAAPPSTSNELPRESFDAAAIEGLSENSNADLSDVLGSRDVSKQQPSVTSNRVPSLSSTENSAGDSAENSVDNVLGNSEGNSDDSTNDSSQGSPNEGGALNEDDSVGPTDLQDSISSSSSAAVVYRRNPNEEQSAIISSSSNDHGRRDLHKAKRACDVSSSTSVSASPCLVVPMPSTSSAVFGEHRLPTASSMPSVPEQNSPDQTNEGSSVAGHFQLPSCFGEGGAAGGSSSSNVTSAELEIAVVSSPTPDAQELLLANNLIGEGSSEQRHSSAAVESSQQEGPAEVSSAVAAQLPGASSSLAAQREEVTSAENSNGLSSAAGNEVTSAVSCPNFNEDNDDGVDGNEAGPLVSELVVNSDEEVSTAEAVLVHSEGMAEITCSTVDAASAPTASGSAFHLDTRPLSVSSTEEAEYLGGSVEVDSHEDVPDVQAFSDVGTGSSCSSRGGAVASAASAAEAAVGTVPPAPDEASSDSHSGVESSHAVSTACDSAPAGVEGRQSQNGTSDQPSQSETGGEFLPASVAERVVQSGNDAEEVYELLICDSEASERITSVMDDSVSSTVFGAQRGTTNPSPSTYHLVSLPSCSSSGPSTSSCSPPVVDVASLTLAYHRTDDAANFDTSSSSSTSSSLSGGGAQPIAADSSAGPSSRDDTAAAAALNGLPGSTSTESQQLQVDNGQNGNDGRGGNSSGSSSSSSSNNGTGSDPATPRNIDDSETFENGAASTSSSVCDVVLVRETHDVETSSEIVFCAGVEVASNMTISSDNCDDDSSSNMPPEDVPSNSRAVSSSAAPRSYDGLANGMQDGAASTSRFRANCDDDSVLSSASPEVDEVASNVVTIEVATDLVERTVTSSASATPASLSQPSTSRGTAGPQLLLKRKRRVNALIDESLCASGHVSGWARVASGLLDRVCKFRGASRSKGMLLPAHWFLEPVDPEDAPGYYDVIEQPMDFSTIKKKLESGQYRDITDFHEDMMLVKRNCQTYNPPDHEAWLDCEEVFAFYLQEYNRLVEKWQKSHLLSSPKRSKPS